LSDRELPCTVHTDDTSEPFATNARQLTKVVSGRLEVWQKPYDASTPR
jgi:hypothetical protein